MTYGPATPGGPSIPSSGNVGTTASGSVSNPFNLTARPIHYGVNHVSWNNPSSSFPWTDYKLVRKFGGFATGETLELNVYAKSITDNVAKLTLPYSTEIYEHMFIKVSDVGSPFDGEFFINRTDSVETISVDTTADSDDWATYPDEITVDDATGIVLGMKVSGTNIADGSYVTGISGSTLTLSENTIAALSTTDVTFSCTTIEYDLTNTNVSNVALTPPGSIEIWAYGEVVASATNPSLFLGVNTIATATSQFKIESYAGGGQIVIGDKPGDPEPPELTTGPLHDDIPKNTGANGELIANPRWSGHFNILVSETYKDTVITGDIAWRDAEVTVTRLSDRYSNRTLSFTGGFVNPGTVQLNDESRGYIEVSQDEITGPVQTFTYTNFYSDVPYTPGSVGDRLYPTSLWGISPYNVDSEGAGFNVAISFPSSLKIPSSGPGIPDLYQGVIINSTQDLDPYAGLSYFKEEGEWRRTSRIDLFSGENYAIGDTLRLDVEDIAKGYKAAFSDNTTPNFYDISGNPITEVDLTVTELAIRTEEILQDTIGGVLQKPRKIINTAGNIHVEYGDEKIITIDSSGREKIMPAGLSQSSTSGDGYGARFVLVYKEGPTATLVVEPTNDDIRLGNSGGSAKKRLKKFTFPTMRVIGIKVLNGGKDYAPGDTITISKNDITWAFDNFRGTSRELTSLLDLTDLYTDITVTVREVQGGQIELVDPVTPVTVTESYLNVPSTTTSSTGSGATFDVYREGLSGTAIPVTKVVLNNPGTGYTSSSAVTIDADDIGLGTRGAEDLVIQCDAPVSTSGTIGSVIYGSSLVSASWYDLTSAPDGGNLPNSVVYDVTNYELTSNVATLTLDDVPVFIVGDQIVVENVADSTFNGSFTITAVDTVNNTIEYSKTATDVTSTAATAGTVELLFKYQNVPALSSFYKGTSAGSGATFDILRRSTGDLYSVSVNKKGDGYSVKDLLVIPKEYIGYTSALRNVFEVVADNHLFDLGRDVSFALPGTDYRSKFHQGKEVYYSMIVGYPTEKRDLPIYYATGSPLTTVFYANDPGRYIPAREPLADVSVVSVKDYNTLDWLFQNLPQIYTDLDEKGDLRDFLSIIAFKIDEFRTEIDFVFNRANPHKTSMKLINLALSQLGIDDEAVRSLGLNKRALVNAIKLYKTKGTTRGVRSTISMYGKPAQELTSRPLTDIVYSRNKILDENSAGFEDGLGLWQPSLDTSLGTGSPTLGLGYRTDTDALEISLTNNTSVAPYYGINTGTLSNTTGSTATRSIIYGPKQVIVSATDNTSVTTALEPLGLAESGEYIFNGVDFERETMIEDVNGVALTLNQPVINALSSDTVYLSRTVQDLKGILSSYIPVVQNLPYVFEIKAKRDESNTDTIKVGIIWRDFDGDIISYDESGTTAKSAMGTGWNSIYKVAVAPVNALYAQPYVTASLASTKVFYLDGLSFSQPEDVLTATRSSGTATLTIRNNGGSYAGSGSVVIKGVGQDFDGTHTISTAATSDGITTITYSSSSTNYPSGSVTNTGYSAVPSSTIEKPQGFTTYVDFVENSYAKTKAVGTLQSAVKDTYLLSREADSLELPIQREEAIYAYQRSGGEAFIYLSYGSSVNFEVGDQVYVSGVYDTSFNGTYTLTAVTTGSISGATYKVIKYANAGSNVSVSTANAIGFTARVESLKVYTIKAPLTVVLNSASASEVVRKSGDVTKRSLTSNVATLTIPDHKYLVGDTVTISNTEINPSVPASQNYDGTFTITATTYNTISYALTGTDEAETELTTPGDSKSSVYHLKYVTSNSYCQFIKAGYVVTVSNFTVNTEFNVTRAIVMDAQFDGTTTEFIVELPSMTSTTSPSSSATAYFSNGLTDKPSVLPYELEQYTL